MELKATVDKLAAENENAKKEAEAARKELSAAVGKKDLLWFLAGAGVFLAGLFVGMAVGSSKSRQRSSGYRF